MPGVAYLMYHELDSDGRELCKTDPGYVRYVVNERIFREQLSRLHEIGYRGVNVSEALGGSGSDHMVAITFDDGCETDLLVAVPLLKEFLYNATFFVVSGWIEQRGYLSKQQVREIADAGFEIGCHSKTHPNLSYLDAAGLHEEIVIAKSEIEQMIGRSVSHFSCPGGFWSAQIARVAADAGFQTVASSRIGTNSPRTDRYRLARVAIYRNFSLKHFESFCRGKGLLKLRNQQFLRDGVRKMLGESSYRRIRSALLGANTL